jgi:hypothetical protein
LTVSNDGKHDLSLFIDDILRTLERIGAPSWNFVSQSSLPRGQKRGARMVCWWKAGKRPTGRRRPT